MAPSIQSARKKMAAFLAVGVFCLISGMVSLIHPVTSAIVPALLFSIAGSSIAVFIAARGGAVIRDEMVRRADVLSGYYTTIATLYSLFACGIINYFYPLPVSVSELLLAMIMLMSLTFILIRFSLLRRGVPE